MKILLATGIYPPESGGPATYTKGLASSLRLRGHEVTVIAYGDTSVERDAVRITRKGGSVFRYLRYAWNVFLLARKSDVVYAQGPVSEGFPATIGAMIAGRPLIMKVVGDYAWEMGMQRRGGLVPPSDRHKGGRTPPLLDEFLTKKHGGLVGLYERIERWTAKRAARMIVPSKYLKSVVERWGVPSERIEVVLNANETLPATLGRDEERRVFGVSDKVVILTAVRAVPWKGVAELVSWWKEMPSTHLLVVAGDGPDLESWKEAARKNGVESRVRFVGRIDRGSLAKWYEAADAFILNSGYEGYPHVVAEAASRGVPCFVSDQGGNPETKETFGDLVTVLPYNDQSKWVSALSVVGAGLSRPDRPNGGRDKPAPTWTHEQMVDSTEKIISGNDDRMQVVMVSYDRDLLDQTSATYARVSSIVGSGVAIKFVVMQGRIFRSVIEGIRQAKRFPGRTIVTAQDPFAAGLVGYLISRWTNTPLEIQEHGDFYSGEWVREDLKNRVLSWFGYFILRRAERIRAVSERVKENLISRGIFAGKIDVIPVSQSLVHSQRSTYGNDLVNCRIVVPCRFVKQKGLDTLLKAAKILKDLNVAFSIQLIGAGPLETQIKQLINSHSLGSIVTISPWQDPATLWKDADMFVLSSNYEGWGRTIVEAMAAGVPIVTTDVGCVGSFFRPQIDGRIVQPNDPVGLAAVIEEQIKETERREWMRDQALERAKTFPTQDELHVKQRDGWKVIITPSNSPLSQGGGVRVGQRFDLWVMALIIFTVLVRALSVALFHASLLNREWGFFTLVQHWFQGYGYSYATELGCSSAYRSPGYLFFLTALYSVFRPENTLAQAIVQNIFVVGIIWLVYAVGKRLVGKRAALVGAFLMAVYPYTFYHYTQYYHTFLSSFFLLLMVWFVLRLAESKRNRDAIGAGLSIGALAYVQGTILVAAPLIVLWLFWKWKFDWKRTLVAAILMAVFSAGLIAPWTYRNWKEMHAFVPLTTDLGFGLYKANNENIYELTKRGYPQEVVDDVVVSSTNSDYVMYRLRPEIQNELERDGVFRDSFFWTGWHPKEPNGIATTCKELGPLNEVGFNSYWIEQANDRAVKTSLGERLELRLLKLKTFWQPALFPSVKTGAPWSFAGNPSKVWLARNAVTAASAVVIIGGFVGLLLAVRRREQNVWLPFAIILVYTFMHTFFAGYTKYRIPLDNFMAIYAGYTLIYILNRIKRIGK